MVATFQRRHTSLPDDIPTPLTDAFAENADKRRQWGAFIKRVAVGEDVSLAGVVEALRTFLLPLIRRVPASQEPARFWPPGGPWKDPA